jgi:hypothetical protein
MVPRVRVGAEMVLRSFSLQHSGILSKPLVSLNEAGVRCYPVSDPPRFDRARRSQVVRAASPASPAVRHQFAIF